jgi:potassium-transporting ATPase potassium-binding subunit
MTGNGWLQILIFFALVLAVTKPLGVFMARLFSGERTFLHRLLRPVEQLLYRVTGVTEAHEMHWTEYAGAMLWFSLVSMLVLYAIQRLQNFLPFNPNNFPALSPHLAFNTAASFTTNTNWQSYSGEATMSYFTQMVGLTFQNFASAAVGIALAIALIRGIARRESNSLGNFWVDLTRASLYLLLPISFIAALFFVSQGVVQNFNPYTVAKGIDAAGQAQTIAQGPVASQLAIKMFGTNGGGFFNANSAHPFENPTPLTNFVQMLLIFAIPAGLTYTLGRMTGAAKHGWAVFAAMFMLSFAGVAVTYWAETQRNPLLPVNIAQMGGNWEGKEVRFGMANSALFATVTTDASCGAVNSMHDSFTPLGGLVPLVNILLGEVVFGGVGAGLYGVLIFVVLAVFIAGLMVGRTPEYLGKKIEAYDIKMAMLYALIFPLLLLTFTAISVLSDSFGLSSLNNSGPHGLSEILYAFTSGTGNNGSAFAGLNANTLWYNTTLGLAMLAGRFLMIVPMLALAGNLSRKKIVPPSAGTFPVTTPLFTMLLISIILILGALTFFPVLSLGPIVEHLLMQAGQVF